MTRLTSEEMMLLRRLDTVPTLADRDCIPERVLINTGLAKRVTPGEMHITDAGRAYLSQQQRMD